MSETLIQTWFKCQDCGYVDWTFSPIIDCACCGSRNQKIIDEQPIKDNSMINKIVEEYKDSVINRVENDPKMQKKLAEANSLQGIVELCIQSKLQAIIEEVEAIIGKQENLIREYGSLMYRCDQVEADGILDKILSNQQKILEILTKEIN